MNLPTCSDIPLLAVSSSPAFFTDRLSFPSLLFVHHQNKKNEPALITSYQICCIVSFLQFFFVFDSRLNVITSSFCNLFFFFLLKGSLCASFTIVYYLAANLFVSSTPLTRKKASFFVCFSNRSNCQIPPKILFSIL